MNKLNIAMVVASPYPANHGTPGSIREMAEALHKLGHNIHIVTYPYGEKIAENGIRLHRVRRISSSKRIKVGPSYEKIFLDMLLARELCKVIKREKIDIIHSHNYEGGIAGYIAKVVTGRPLVYHAVNTMIDELHTYNFIRPEAAAKGLARVLDYTVPRAADSILAISDELVNFLLSQKIEPHKIARIPLGVDPEIFGGKDPAFMRNKYGIGQRPLVVYTGLLNKFQRVDYLLRAMKIVVEKMEDALLLIVANLVDKSDLQRHKGLIRELGIRNNVIFTDERPFTEVPCFLASADVVVLPRPDCPGFPVKLLNYMAAGKAIVAFKGSSKGLENMKNALLVEDHNYEQMGEGIKRLLQDKKLADSLGRGARVFAEEAYGWEKIAEGIEKTYRYALSQQTDKKSNLHTVTAQYRSYDRRVQKLYLYHPDRRRQGLTY